MDRRLGLGLLLAGLLFCAGFLLRDFLLAGFVRPMALLLWIGNRLIATVDQTAYWAGLILLLAFASLLRLSKQTTTYKVRHAENENATLFSIRHWRTLILLTSDETDRLNFLKQSLQRLLKDIYAAKEPSQVPWKIDEDIEQGNIRLPGTVQEFLMLAPPAQAPPTLAQRLRRLGQGPARWYRHWTKQDVTEYYQSIAEVISLMEKELENEDEQ